MELYFLLVTRNDNEVCSGFRTVRRVIKINQEFVIGREVTFRLNYSLCNVLTSIASLIIKR